MHLNDLNLKLQCKKTLVHKHKLHAQVKAFETKLRLWETQVEKGYFTHFPTLSQSKLQNKEKYT